MRRGESESEAIRERPAVVRPYMRWQLLRGIDALAAQMLPSCLAA